MAIDLTSRRDIPSRFECKYLLPRAYVHELRMMLRPFVEPDRFARRWPQYRYPISSLYLDSPDYFLYSQTDNGEKNRFKLRIRSYDDEPGTPVFFEVKKRMNGIVSKWRSAVRRDMAARYLSGGILSGGPRDPAPDLGEFQRDVAKVGAGPVCRVRYQREAYEAKGGEPTRITFDSDLTYNLTHDGNLATNGPGWESVPMDTVILEVKFTERFPTWIQDIVDTFDLQRTSVPKYGLCIGRALARQQTSIPMVRHRSLLTRA